MKKYKYFLIFGALISCLLFIAACTEQYSELVKDIIPNINLSAGSNRAVAFSDLIYVPNYNVTFSGNENIILEYNNESNILQMSASEDFEGMTLIEFKIDDDVHSRMSVVKLKETLIGYE